MTGSDNIDDAGDSQVQEAKADLRDDPEADAAAEDLELSDGVKKNYEETLERGAHQQGEGRFA